MEKEVKKKIKTNQELTMEIPSSSHLHTCHVAVHNLFTTINRSHTLIHSLAISIFLYYRLTSFFFLDHKRIPTTLLFLLSISEFLLSFMWLLSQAYRWRPISRKVFPERLPPDDQLPGVDVFIFTADPEREPIIRVMNTVLSAMALDYPPEKLHIYLSDDGGAAITLVGMREAWKFARSWWLPFCRKYGMKTSSPEAYFSGAMDGGERSRTTTSPEFVDERQRIKEKYVDLKERIRKAKGVSWPGDTNTGSSTDHSPIIQVVRENCDDELEDEEVEMPLLVYVSREKRPSYPHHFKAGAINVLLRVSGILSNSPYILMLDCDMNCNDPTSARQAMCFHLDPKISPKLAFVQFPQIFGGISRNDIYDAELRNIFRILWYGMDGLQGPCVSGTNFYLKRESLYGTVSRNVTDLKELHNSFGYSHEFIKSMILNNKLDCNVHRGDRSSTVPKECYVLSSCSYEDNTNWGKEVGFRYFSVVEDYFTSFTSLHCKGWTSVYLNPSKPAFVGTAATNLNDLLIQGTRWASGLTEVGISKFCPLFYGPPRKALFLESMCYAELALSPLLHSFSLWCMGTIPQLCLLNGIPLYPEVSGPFFLVLAFIFFSALFKHTFEDLIIGGSIQTVINEQRIWMIKSVTCQTYGTLDAVMKKLNLRKASFLPTNKVIDDEQIKRYQMGVFDFQTSIMFLAPMVSVVLLNIVSLLVGVIRIVVSGGDAWNQMFVQVFLSFYILVMGYPIVEGMILRKDKGRINTHATAISAVLSVAFMVLGSAILLMY